MVKVLNTIHEDYHIHSINYSDGMNTIDEIVQYAGKIGMKKIVITDHSQIAIDINNLWKKTFRAATKRRKNVHNDVEVSFGVEWDLLDEEGNCCFDIQGKEPDFCILSCHEEVFKWDLKNITHAYINAIKKHHNKISFLGHVCLKNTSQYLDIETLIKVANKYHIPIEFNAKCFVLDRTDKEKLDKMLNLADQIYINSDGHMLADLEVKETAFDYLKEKGYI